MAADVLETSSFQNFSRSKCVIGIDRDGTINIDKGTYVWKPEDFNPIPGSLEAIAKLRMIGHGIAIITNQSGIDKGLYTPQDVDNTHDYMLKLLGEEGCPSIDAIYYAAGSQKQDPFVKPNIGMFKRCEKEHPYLNFKQGYYVGDKISDLKAALKAGAIPVLVRTGYGNETEELLNRFTYKSIAKKTMVFDDLWSFSLYLEQIA